MRLVSKFVLLGSLAIVIAGTQSPLRTQEVAGEVKERQRAIFGRWSEVWYENEGTVYSPIPNPKLAPHSPGPIGAPVWDISKDEIEIGADGPGYVRRRFKVILEPGGTAGAMDLFPIQDAKNIGGNSKIQAIYDLKGDILTVCLSDDNAAKRPQYLKTKGEPKSTWLFVLRRGTFKWNFGGPARPI